MTRQRQIITQVIRRSPEHLTADKICELARHDMPGIAVGTVYRNLGRMVEDGEIMRISVPDAPDRYDKNPIAHEHMICSRCGRMVDVCIDGLDEFIAERCGCAVSGHMLVVLGVCGECASESTSDNTTTDKEILS